MFEILWPEHCFVSEEQIRTWYSDAVANCEAEETDLQNSEDMAKELSYIGIITLKRRNR